MLPSECCYAIGIPLYSTLFLLPKFELCWLIREQQPGHREEEAGQDRDVEQVGLGGQDGRLEEESQAGGEQGKMARKWERGVEGDGGQQPGEGEHQVESHPGRKQVSEF